MPARLGAKQFQGRLGQFVGDNDSHWDVLVEGPRLRR
jgi:hypothetical protein